MELVCPFRAPHLHVIPQGRCPWLLSGQAFSLPIWFDVVHLTLSSISVGFVQYWGVAGAACDVSGAFRLDSQVLRLADSLRMTKLWAWVRPSSFRPHPFAFILSKRPRAS